MAEQEEQRPIKGYPDSLGPDIHSGGEQEPGGLVPPYEGHKTETPRSEAEAMASVFSVDDSAPAPEREISDTERQGVPPTDTTAASPLGVGETRGRQGNEQALKMSEEKRRKDREETGIDSPKSTTPGSPNLQVGDQGG
ncbi:MAG: hypothetical protein ACREX8_16415 [Gammaproteobacteria bacterium]